MAKSVCLGIVVCFYAASLYYVSVQMRIMQTQATDIYYGTYMWAPALLAGMQQETLKILSSEMQAAEKPMSDVFMKTLVYSLQENVQKISSDFITVISNGFFPSNLMQTFQALLEYNFQLAAEAVWRTTSGVSNAYWYTYQSTGNYRYLTTGNAIQVASQVALTVSLITPLTQNTYIPTQDSWVGNFLTSIPNVTYNTFGDGNTWTYAFSNTSKIFANLAAAHWSGTYGKPHGQRAHWNCYGCSDYFNELSTQAGIIAKGPSLSQVVMKFPPKKITEKKETEKHHHSAEHAADAQSPKLPTMSNQGKPMEEADSHFQKTLNTTQMLHAEKKVKA